MIKRILVPLDESALAEQAIPVAARIARASLSSILLIRVVNTNSEFGGYMNAPTTVLAQDMIDNDIAGATGYLAQISKSPMLVGIRAETDIFTGSPAAQIIDVARVQHIDLIVMCSHGEIGVKRWVMGNVAHKVVRHSSVPVLVLHAEGNKSATLCDTQRTKPLRALITLDGSPFSETVLDPMVQVVSKLAAPGQGHIHLLRVIGTPNFYGRLPNQHSIDSLILKEMKQKAETYMRLIVDRLYANLPAPLSPSALTITTSLKIEVDVAGTIVNVAEHGDDGEEDVGGYDLIAMATHGRSAITRWTLGSVTERVLDSTKLPLLIVRPHGVQS